MADKCVHSWSLRSADPGCARWQCVLCREAVIVHPYMPVALERSREKIHDLLDAGATLIARLNDFTEGQSVKTRQRLDMAQTYFERIAVGDTPDEAYGAVCGRCSDTHGLVSWWRLERANR